jgi:hypothetical protein
MLTLEIVEIEIRQLCCVVTDKVDISIRYIFDARTLIVGIFMIESWTEMVGPTRIPDGLRPICQ